MAATIPCDIGSAVCLKAKDAYKIYRDWCDENGYRNPVNNLTFGKRLKRVGVDAGHNRDGGIYSITTSEILSAPF
jgi:phage/plasmid-associated DNA primase